MLTTEMINELVKGLVDIFGKNVQQIILYGSVAREEEKDDSDIDIAIILNHGFDSVIRERFITWASELDLKYGRVFSIIDIEKDNMDKWGNVLPFYKNIRQEGVVLWKVA
jgi:predicted nucleotidyltransferase